MTQSNRVFLQTQAEFVRLINIDLSNAIRFRSGQTYGIFDRLVGDFKVFVSLSDLRVDLGPMSLLSI